MEEKTYESDKNNGEPSFKDEQEDDDNKYSNSKQNNHPFNGDGEGDGAVKSLYAAVSGLLLAIFFPETKTTSSSSTSFFHRTKASVRENLPHIREASRDSGLRVLRWARHGSPLRLLLVISVGTITLLTLTGILVFLLFLAAATINAIILSLFMSLAAAGGFLAIFFACVAVIYIGALSVAVFVISSVTISAIITALIVTGWIGFFWTLWVATRKSVGFAKHSVSVTGSALSAWNAQRHSHRHHHD